MDSSTETDKETKYLNVCRCCLKEDGFLDIFTAFPRPELKQTCDEMFKNTFDIQISNHPTIAKSLICESCINVLLQATIFKQMVLNSEETYAQWLENYNKNEFKEIIKEDAFQDYDHSAEEDVVLANLKSDLRLEENGSVKPRKCKLERKTKSKKFKVKEDHELEKNIQPQKDWSKIAERRGTGPLLRENSLKLIQNSNLCVFQWNKSRYRCFCCNTPFSDINLLKSHTFTEHTIENIEKKIILQQNRLVKVEISNLECKLCRNSFDGIPNLVQHFKMHAIEITEHLLVPFRIEEELVCQICFKKFTMFRLLNIHINKHYQKQVCHICGAGFSNLVFLNLHKTRSHRPFDCKTCNLEFDKRIEKKHHDMATHGIKQERKLRFPCPFCPARFFQENFKVRHMVEKHGIPKPDFKCSICPKTFLTRSLCNNHVKNVHNKEKNKECDICHTFFYTKSDVARHKVTHTGEKKFSCVICNNPFASKDSLRRHMKRTHVGVH